MFPESVFTLILCLFLLVLPKLPYEGSWIFLAFTFMFPTQLLNYTFKLRIHWQVAVVLKNNESSVIIVYLLYSFHIIRIFFCVQCSNPAELPKLVCSHTKMVRNNVHYMHRMKMQWLVSIIMRIRFSRVLQKAKKQQLALWTCGIGELDYILMQCSILM